MQAFNKLVLSPRHPAGFSFADIVDNDTLVSYYTGFSSAPKFMAGSFSPTKRGMQEAVEGVIHHSGQPGAASHDTLVQIEVDPH